MPGEVNLHRGAHQAGIIKENEASSRSEDSSAVSDANGSIALRYLLNFCIINKGGVRL